MKIGIDLDGVVIDSEATFRTYEEIFDIDNLQGDNLINKEEPKFQARYNWSEEQEKEFIEKYFLTVSKESNLMAGFIGAYNLLKKQGHEFVVITARGGFVKEMKDDAIRLLEENNINFDKYYWKVDDKLEICKNENVDIMIDDDWKIIKQLSDNHIKTLYFRDTNLVKLEENEYIKEVNNWGDIYRIIKREEMNGILYDNLIMKIENSTLHLKDIDKIDIKSYIGKTITAKIDRQMGAKHPQYGFIYPINYGYIQNTISGDGEELDCYVLGVFEPIESFTGKCIAVIHRLNDNEDKLVLVPKNKKYTNDEIRVLTEFQERFFESIIII